MRFGGMTGNNGVAAKDIHLTSDWLQMIGVAAAFIAT
jgi:hypothetical protein